jgi:nicotinate-nucleotide adenylyltransferase
VKIALFGGTFDPIHSGHLRAARAAARKFQLHKVLFVPSGTPPHKVGNRLTPFAHRFAMVALACEGEPRFIPSLLEAPRPDGRPHFSVDTARTAARLLGPKDQLYFLVGLDAFLDLPHWKKYRRLLDLVRFIVVSRPGFGSKEIARAITSNLIDAKGMRSSHRAPGQDGNFLVLSGVNVPVASSDIREAVRTGRPVTGLIPRLVEEYILKEGLYRPDSKPRRR